MGELYARPSAVADGSELAAMKTNQNPASPNETYHNLPPLAGLCSLEQAARPGLLVEQCVDRLKRYHYAFKRLHEIFTARITAEPIY